MSNTTLLAGQVFPSITVTNLEGKQSSLTATLEKYDWKLVIVYRGNHCPLCTKYLTTLNQLLPEIQALGVDVIAVSADSKEKAQIQTKEIRAKFEVGYGLTVEQMQKLGLYISHPRSAAEAEQPFSEPALFVINDKVELQLIDISNAPFIRPDLNSLLMGLNFIRNPDNNYPIRGTY